MEISEFINKMELKICMKLLVKDVQIYHTERKNIKQIFEKIRKYKNPEAIITSAYFELSKWCDKSMNFMDSSTEAIEELEQKLKDLKVN